MRLICPHCGLKGTADDALLEKKVRCPQCQKIFRLTETNAALAPPSQAEHIEVPASQVIQQPGAVTAPDVGTCSVCGFSLSHDFLENRAGKVYCRLCLPA